MIAIDQLAVSESEKRFINIRDASRNYQTAFWLEDGKSLTVIRPDGTKGTNQCRYIDQYHFYFGTMCFHIDQFAELVKNNGWRCEPEEYITDLRFYTNSYLDRNLKDTAGKRIPYKSIVGIEHGPRDFQIISVCPHTIIDKKVAFWDGTGDKAPDISFYSIPRARMELLPKLDLSKHEQNLLHAVFEEIEKQIPRISQQEYDAIPNDYKGQYQDLNGSHPDWKGRRTAFLPGHGTTLFIEGVSFIIDDGKKASLDKQVKTAISRSESAHKPSTHLKPTKER